MITDHKQSFLQAKGRPAGRWCSVVTRDLVARCLTKGQSGFVLLAAHPISTVIPIDLSSEQCPASCWMLCIANTPSHPPNSAQQPWHRKHSPGLAARFVHVALPTTPPAHYQTGRERNTQCPLQTVLSCCNLHTAQLLIITCESVSKHTYRHICAQMHHCKIALTSGLFQDLLYQ